MNEDLVEIRDHGTCSLQVYSTLKRLEETGFDVSSLILSVNYFDSWICQWEDYTTIQREFSVPNHSFMKQVTSWWVIIGPANEQWYVKVVPQNVTKDLKKKNYKEIIQTIIKPFMKTQEMFVIESA
uniref:Uncharacterized protein n=1 Tax=Cuerna arida TaxID=1464854 RepID=A0A1B6G332_9HEMI